MKNQALDVYNKIYLVGDKTAFHSVEWLSGIIAHDSNHSKLYWDYIKNNGPPIPNDIWMGQSAELICNKIQAKCLERIGAPRYMIDYVISSNGNHFDINKNGKYDYQDDELRNW